MFSDKFYKISNIIISIFIALLSLLVIGYTLFYPKITLKGSSNITLNYKEQYKEKGYKAKIFGKDISKYVKVEGKDNNLLELIAQDEAFHLSIEELQETMQPSRYIGRSKEQVEMFLSKHIQPILEEYAELIGGSAEIHV